jgi:ATP-binding cassette subfamily B protein
MKTALTQVRREDIDEANQRPLELALIWRMFRYTKPHARKRNGLFALVVVRSIQLPILAWEIGAVINGPITHHDERGVK